MNEYLIKGRLAEEDQIMDFPVAAEDSKPAFRARCHVGRGISGTPHYRYTDSKNLVYAVVPSGTQVYFDWRKTPVSFANKDTVLDTKFYGSNPHSIQTDGLSVIKIHPGTPFYVELKSGTPYHSFEWLQTPDSYRDPDSMHPDFVALPSTVADDLKIGAEQLIKFLQDERIPDDLRAHVYEDVVARISRSQNVIKSTDWVSFERQNRTVHGPGYMIYSENTPYRLPIGWIMNWFNGSPEFGLSIGRYSEPRKDEVLHAHHEVMEPYMCRDGVETLFVAIDGGSESLTVNSPEDQKIDYRGELIDLQPGDIAIPVPGVPHKIFFRDGFKTFSHFCINYSSKSLFDVRNDRTVLEK